MRLEPLRVLSDAEVREIHEASLAILAGCGVRVHSPAMLDALAERGVDVDRQAGIARFSRACIEDAVANIPPTFEVFDREGEPAFVLGDGEARFAAGHNAVFWLDSDTGETRPSTVADVEAFSRICERLECIDAVGIPVMPQDVPNPAATLLHGVKAVVENSRKPIFFSTDSAAVNRAVIEMARAAFAGDLGSQVYAISQLSPTSPLQWERGVCEAILDTVTTNVPLPILPEPNAGVSAPYTLAGLLTVNNAECLSGLAMIQLLRPGAKVMYANSWTTTDMRTGSACVGSTETSLCRAAGAQLGKFYRCPTHTTAPNSDNHAHDEQNAWEKTFSTFLAAAAGNDLIVNCGMFATGMTCSHEQLIMDEEICAMSRRIVRGIEVSPETIAADLIESIGPGGSYLTCEHTLKRLRGGEHLEPRVSVRGPFAAWAAKGARDTTVLAREKARKLSAEPAGPLDAKRAARLAEIVNAFSV